MNIIFFHGNGIVPTFGGISRITDTLGKLLRQKGHNVWYIGAQDKHKDVATYDENQVFLPSQDLFSEDNVAYVSGFVRKRQIDIIINQSALNPQSAKFLALCKEKANFVLISCFHNSILTPVINGAYQKEYLLKKRGLGWIFRLMRSKLVSSLIISLYIKKFQSSYLSTIERSDAVCVLCDGQVKELCRMCGIEQSNKIHVVPNCIEVGDAGNLNKQKVVLWVGTFDYAVKRPDNMLYIWKQVEANSQGWQLKMLGDGPSLEEMKSLSRKLGLQHVVFTGRVTPDKYYNEAAIACVSSVHEAFPLVSIEAQKAGCVPVVNNSFTSAPMIVKNGENGILVPAFDNDSFAKALLSLMKDDEKRNRLSHQAMIDVQRFSLETVYNQWMNLFKELYGAVS